MFVSADAEECLMKSTVKQNRQQITGQNAPRFLTILKREREDEEEEEEEEANRRGEKEDTKRRGDSGDIKNVTGRNKQIK